MLNLILGTTGSGKTTLLYEQVKQEVAAGRRAIVIVPEQYSFETERALYDRLGAEQALHAEVLSFTRLCNRIFREYGGLAGDYIDGSARLLLMSLTLAELKDALELYSSRIHNPSFVEAMVAQVSEFKNAGISPEMLGEFAQAQAGRLPSDPLTGKAKELSLIYQTYQAMIGRSYRDAEDDITEACGCLEANDFFSDYAVFLDGFKSFTAGELMLLEHAVARSPQVYITLCTDSLEDHDNGMGLFTPVKRTAARLRRIAQEFDVPWRVLAALTEPYRFQSDDLRHLERNLFRAEAEPYTETCKAISLVTAQGQYEEIEFVAAAIREAVRIQGLRYREIAVIGRDLASYTQPLESVLERYEIPYFMDQREDVTNKPLTAALLHAVDAVKGRAGFDTDEVFALLKTTLPGLTPEEIGDLENYCFVWNIRGAAWLEPFRGGPQGFGSMSQEDEARLERLNALRGRVAGPLGTLQESVRDCDGVGFARAVYRYLEESGILEGLRQAAQKEEPDEVTLSSVQLYDTVVDLLDQFAVILGEKRLSAQRFAELLRLVLSSVEVGVLPQTLDQVIVGSADRIRVGEPKLVFLVGVNEGVFPKPYQAGGLLTDAERERLMDSGLEISDTAEAMALEETYSAYLALCSASQRLYVCWARSSLKGAALYPSSIVKAVRAVLPFAPVLSAEELPPDFYVQNPGTAFDAFCQNLRHDNGFTAALAEYLREVGDGARVERLLHPVRPADHRLLDQANRMDLYGRHIQVSPTKLDRFHQCRMAYFLRFGLGLKPRRRAELSPIESGTVVHFVLQNMLLRHPADELPAVSEGTLREEVHALLEQYLEENMGGAEDKSARFQYLFTRLENTLVRLVRHLAQEFAVSQFRPAAFELPIRREAPDSAGEAPCVEPLEFELASGGTVRVEGVVDRVDLMEKNGVPYLRVVDYKTGSKEFSLSDVYYGMNLQMLVYLFTLQKKGSGALAGAVPAGILYLPAKTAFSPLDRKAGPEKAEQKQLHAMRMSGLLLDSLEALSGMEAGCEGKFIPVSVKPGKDGEPIIKGPVATLAEFGRLERHVEKLIVQMASTLREGDIAAVPTYTKGFDQVCEYCEYRGVCGREESDARRDAAELSREEFFEQIGKEEA